MAINKVVYSGNTLIDLTGDTVTADKLAKGITAHDKAGNSISGTMESGGETGMNVQGYHGMATVKATAYTATAVSLTVKKTGTYKVSWIGARNTSSGTNGSQLYVNGAARGSAYTTFTNTYAQSVTMTGVSLNAGDVLVVRARSRSTSYAMMVGNLIIEQTA